MEKENQITIYENANGKIEVKLEDETVWLTQKQIADIFEKDISTINEHVINIFKEKELQKESVIRKFRITASDGKSYNTNCYNRRVEISTAIS